MRKLTVHFKPKSFFNKYHGFMTEFVESIELVEMLKVDFERGLKIGIVNINLKNGFKFEDIKFPKLVLTFQILKQSGSTYTCLMRTEIPKILRPLGRKFDLDLIFTKPTIFRNGISVVSCMGSDAELNKLLKLLPLMGTIEKTIFQNADYNGAGLLNNLTLKQRDVLFRAKQLGYYDYPRKISSEDLAKDLGISKSTVVEHLRKAEINMMNSVLEGV